MDSPYLLKLCFWIKQSIVSYLSLLNLEKAVSQVIKVPGMSWIKGGCTSTMGFPGSSSGKESACNAGDPGLTPGSRRSTQEAIGYPLQYSGLQNSLNRGAWQATVHGVAKSQTQLSTSTIRNPTKPVDPPMVHLPRGENWVLLQEVTLPLWSFDEWSCVLSQGITLIRLAHSLITDEIHEGRKHPPERSHPPLSCVSLLFT